MQLNKTLMNSNASPAVSDSLYCIRTRRGIYGKIWPEPKGFLQGASQGKSWGLKQYLTVYPDSSPNMNIIPFLTMISWFKKNIYLWVLSASASLLHKNGPTLFHLLFSLTWFCFSICIFVTTYNCLQPFYLNYANSRLITEVKQGWALLVLGWVNGWE